MGLASFGIFVSVNVNASIGLALSVVPLATLTNSFERRKCCFTVFKIVLSVLC